MILTVDFGTSVTKVGLWDENGLAAMARSELTTTHPQVGWAEQEPLRWWTSLVIACAEARAQAPRAFGDVEVVVCSGARQTFVPVTAAGRTHVLDEVRDVMEGGGAGMAMGRTIYQDPDPAEAAGLVHALVHGR